jgi:hypothetical protein
MPVNPKQLKAFPNSIFSSRAWPAQLAGGVPARAGTDKLSLIFGYLFIKEKVERIKLKKTNHLE